MDHAVVRSFFGVIVILSFVDTSIEECVPHSWSHPWSRVGRTWYTRIANSAIFDDLTTLCEGIESGRTGIARIETEEEKKHLIGQFGPTDKRFWWIGGIRVGSHRWYWYKRVGGKAVFSEMKKTFWQSGYPLEGENNRYCMKLNRSTGEWLNTSCVDLYLLGGVICELRC